MGTEYQGRFLAQHRSISPMVLPTLPTPKPNSSDRPSSQGLGGQPGSGQHWL